MIDWPSAGHHLVDSGRDDLWQPSGDSQPLTPPLRLPSAAGSTLRTTWRSRKLGSPGAAADETPCADGVPIVYLKWRVAVVQGTVAEVSRV